MLPTPPEAPVTSTERDRFNPGALEAAQREQGGEPGGTDHHGRAGIEALWQGYHPVGRDSGQLGETPWRATPRS